MATYTYRCTNEECETDIFTFNRPMSEYKDPTNCKECESSCNRLENDFSATFALKGQGWYRDGYGTTDAKGRPIGNTTAVTNSAKSYTSKTHKK